MTELPEDWQVEWHGATFFAPLARTLGIDAEDIMAAVRIAEREVMVLYTREDEADGFMAILEFNEKKGTLKPLMVQRVENLAERVNDLLRQEAVEEVEDA